MLPPKYIAEIKSQPEEVMSADHAVSDVCLVPILQGQIRLLPLTTPIVFPWFLDHFASLHFRAHTMGRTRRPIYKAHW